MSTRIGCLLLLLLSGFFPDGLTASESAWNTGIVVLNPRGDTLILSRPMGLSFDTRGRLVTADLINRRLRFFEPRKIFPCGDILEAGFLVPWALAVDEQDRIYVSDTGRNQIIVMSEEGKILNVIGKKGKAPGSFVIPAGLAVDPRRNRLIVADFANHVVQVLATDGTYLGHIGAAIGTPGRREGTFRGPSGVAVDAQGRIYVTDKENCRIQIFHASRGFIASFGHPGASAGNFDRPSGVAVDESGLLAVCDTFNNRVQVFAPVFTSASEPRLRVRKILSGAGPQGGPLKLPNKCAFSPSGDLFVSDTGNNRIIRFPAALFR